MQQINITQQNSVMVAVCAATSQSFASARKAIKPEYFKSDWDDKILLQVGRWSVLQ